MNTIYDMTRALEKLSLPRATIETNKKARLSLRALRDACQNEQLSFYVF